MRAGIFLAYWPWFSPEEQVELAVLADELGLDSVWISEAWGQDAVSVLGLLAGKTERVALGSGLFQIPARAADRDRDGRRDARRAVAAGASGSGSACPGRRSPRAGTACRSRGRCSRTREYVEIVRMALARETVVHEGREYGCRSDGAQAAEAARQAGAGADPDLPRRGRAEGGRAGRRDRRRLAAVHARPRARRHAARAAATAASRRPAASRADIDVAAVPAMAVEDDLDAARDAVRPWLAFYLGAMGAQGEELLRRAGRARRATATPRASARRRSSAATASARPRALTPELIDAMALATHAGRARRRGWPRSRRSASTRCVGVPCGPDRAGDRARAGGGDA